MRCSGTENSFKPRRHKEFKKTTDIQYEACISGLMQIALCRLFTARSRLAGMIRMGLLNLAHCRRDGQEQIRQCKLATTYLAKPSTKN